VRLDLLDGRFVERLVVEIRERDEIDVIAPVLHFRVPKLIRRVPIHPHDLSRADDELIGDLVIDVH